MEKENEATRTAIDGSVIWDIIGKYFEDNPHALVRHQIESYNDFFNNGIYQIFKENNPLKIASRFDDTIGEYRSQCFLYLGGKDATKIYFGKPVIYDEGNTHYMCPNEARLRNMTYGMTIHYDIDVEFVDVLESNEPPSIVGGEFMRQLDAGAIDVEANFERGEDRLPANYKLTAAEEAAAEAEGKTMGGDADESAECMYESAEDAAIRGGVKGGAPKRKKREDKIQFKTTPAISALLKEAAEKSVAENRQRRVITIEKVYLGKFPIMLHSKFCILDGLSREARYMMGECKNDLGGYFIIDGKEKTVVPQEKFADNMLYIREYSAAKAEDADAVPADKYLCSAEIRSVSENVKKPIRTFSVRMVSPTSKYTNRNIVVNIPNVRQPVPLFIVFRALGIVSDRAIIQMCLLNLDRYEDMIDLFIPSVHDGASIMTQQVALKYISSLTKWKTISYVHEILADYFLPHIGEINYIQKAYFLGYMVFRLLCVSQGIEKPTDRDNFKYKRIELVGSLLHDLFREYYNIQMKEIHLGFEEKLYYNAALYESNLFGLVQQNYREIFRERSLETGLKKAFKGNWGAYTHTKRVGVVQDLNRLSFNSALSHLRKTNLPMDASVKLVGPRVLHSSQWGIIDPIDTPDGANIGLHKHLAIMTYVTRGYSREPLIRWLREKTKMRLVEECTFLELDSMTRVIVNGLWAGMVENPIAAISVIRLHRRNALIPIYTSATFDVRLNTVFIYTDAGRACRPIFYVDDFSRTLSCMKKAAAKRLAERGFSWMELISGFNAKKIRDFEPSDGNIYDLPDLYEGVDKEANPAKMARFLEDCAVIDYIDGNESENALIAINMDEYETGKKAKQFTHCEIHESLMYGVMCNMINFIENNPPTRNSFSCGQSKQAVSMYHMNYQVRMDKTAVVLNYGQVPLVKTRYLQYINNEENPYGENAIVAIMCYTGYNVEDAILVNEGALQRGLFRTTYFTCYEAHEESTKNASSTVDKRLTNIEGAPNVVGTKPGYDYSKLDAHGLIREGTLVDDKTILIGLTSNSVENPDVLLDLSKGTKKGQVGVVDKTFIAEGEEGERIAKVRVVEQRIPTLGDKMASRAGQKGTIGLVIPERDMPYTKDGLVPDLIINPHAIPSRMTIGQLVECITGKACAMQGTFGECTAFINKGSKVGLFGELCSMNGFHSSGTEILYNGMTGQQIESEIFVGPTYYMRLKHMVKDKINYRALGPRSALTKQAVGGRANDGGLRIGEMERDSVISHGISNFLCESMMERGDKCFIAVCNKTGMLSIYNPSAKLFLSPMADGPVKFTTTIDDSQMNVERITQFGRSFSVVAIPYSLKLLIQELQTINVQMRIITEDTIMYMDNLMYSRNMERLCGVDGAKPSHIVDAIKAALETGEDASAKLKRIAKRSAAESRFGRDAAGVADSPEEREPASATKYAEHPASQTALPESEPAANNPPDERDIAPSALAPPLAGVGVQQNPDETYGGGSRVDRRTALGDDVFLRGDAAKPARKWTVVSIGDKYITIKTLDMEGLASAVEATKVVERGDIYYPEDVVEAERDAAEQYAAYSIAQQNPQAYPPQMGGGLGDGNGWSSAGTSVAAPLPMGLTFSPTIRVVGGNDNSVNPPPPPAPSAGGAATPQIQAADGLFAAPVVKIGGGPQAAAVSAADDKKSDGGEFDFKTSKFDKLLIKKI
jgi:DNA-directed RNA polymerase II subunit RPB2